jgi:hypothetical protein
MKLDNFIICDDIRTEVSNKYSLIGVYNDALNFFVPESAVGSWPKVIRLGLFIRVDIENIEELKKIGRFVLESKINNEVDFHIEQNFINNMQENQPMKRMVISVVVNQFNIKSSGDMELSLLFLDKNSEPMQKFCYPGNIKITDKSISAK